MGLRRLAVASLLLSVIACGRVAENNRSNPEVDPEGAGNAAGAGDASVSTGAGAPLLALQGEYWIRTDQLPDPIHVRVVSDTEASVEGNNDSPANLFPRTFAIETGSAELGVEPPSTMTGAEPAVRGAYVLHAKDPLADTETGIAAIALDAGEPHTAGIRALIAYAADGGTKCLVHPNHVWQTLSGRVTADHDLTEVTIDAPTVPLGLIPWEAFGLRASKSAGEGLAAGASFQSPGIGAVEVRPGDNYYPMLIAQGSFLHWVPLVGHTVEVAGEVVNTNGAGSDPPGSSAWSGSINVLDFGPSRTGVLDFANGAPADLITWGGELLENDAACVPPQVALTPGAVGACLRLTGGQGLAVRFQGPLRGVRVHGHSNATVGIDLRLGSSIGVFERSTFDSDFVEATVENGTADELFAVVSVPATFDSQTDPACRRPSNWTAYIESIEPLAP